MSEQFALVTKRAFVSAWREHQRVQTCQPLIAEAALCAPMLPQGMLYTVFRRCQCRPYFEPSQSAAAGQIRICAQLAVGGVGQPPCLVLSTPALQSHQLVRDLDSR